MFACYESLDHAIGLEETRRFPRLITQFQSKLREITFVNSVS